MATAYTAWHKVVLSGSSQNAHYVPIGEAFNIQTHFKLEEAKRGLIPNLHDIILTNMDKFIEVDAGG